MKIQFLPFSSLVTKNLFRFKSFSTLLLLHLLLFILFGNQSAAHSISKVESENYNQSKSVALAHHGFLRLEADAQTHYFTTDFYFNSNASLGLDPGYDATLFSGVAPAYAIYSHLVNENVGMPYGIQTLGPEDMNDVTIPLGINANQGQNISVAIAQSDLSPSINIYLEDLENDTTTQLNNGGNYNFTVTENLSGSGRFYLRFESRALSIDQSGFNQIKIVSNIKMKTLDIIGKSNALLNVKVFDLNGRLTKSIYFEGLNQYNSLDVSGLVPSIYVISLNSLDSNHRLTQKVMIN